MKITICQLNYTVGDISGNTKKIVDAITQAQKKQNDLIIFSELAVIGYPPSDVLFNTVFIDDAINVLHQIATYCTEITAIVGGIEINNNNGKRLFNAAYILSNGKIQKVYHKSILTSCDVFDEAHYFEPSMFKPSLFKVHEQKIFITIGEELWNVNQNAHLAEEIMNLHPDMVINISALPYSIYQYEQVPSLLQAIYRKFNCPLLYVNQVGFHNHFIFAGGSTYIKEHKKHILPFFEESVYEINTEQEVIEINEPSTISLLYRSLIYGIKEFFVKNKFSKAVLGLSGGIDSAVVALLAADALGNENVHALLMPSRFSSNHSVTDAVELCQRNKIKYDILSIEKPFQAFESSLSEIFKGKKTDVTEENIQARIRAIYLMAYSNKFGHILLNTSNKSELAVGYGTMYGDLTGAISVLGDIYKTQVYQLAEYINRKKELIPLNIIQKPPSAELHVNQKDSDTLPDYAVLDKILYAIIEEHRTAEEVISLGFDKETVIKVLHLIKSNEYKHFQAPPVLHISPKIWNTERGYF